MSEFAIEVEGGKSVLLKTAGKYCDRNIVVTATGGGGGDTDAAYQQGVTDGKQAEYDKFWDAYQNSGGYVFSYAYAFGSSRWTDEVYNPKYPISSDGGYFMERMFANSAITDTKVPIIVQRYSFITNMFTSSKIKTIRKLVFEYSDGVKTTKSFDNCTALENITIEGVLSGQSGQTDPNFQWSPLTKESIKNIISCLSDTQTDAVTAAFSLSAVNTAFETSQGAADGSTSAEWLALVDTKSNWTISLV